MRKALFVVVEGADICGKTTQVEWLADRFLASGIKASKTSFPRYETDVGKAIERHLKGQIFMCEDLEGENGLRADLSIGSEDALAFQALQTMDKLEAAADILELLESGVAVISSRWWQSAVVYGADLGLDVGRLARTHSLLPQADLNVLLTLSEEESLARRPELRDRFERDREKQARVRAAYAAMWKDGHVLDPTGWVAVDGNGSPLDVHEKIWGHVVARLSHGMWGTP